MRRRITLQFMWIAAISVLLTATGFLLLFYHTFDSDSEKRAFTQMAPYAILLMLLFLAIGFLSCILLSRLLTKRILKPIEKMAMNLDGINQESTYGELLPLITRIKEQHIKILKNATMRQQFTANVSHELKTPLTAISGYAELIENGMAGENTNRFAMEIRSNANRLLSLIEDILRIAEMDEADRDFEMEQVNLYQAAKSCVEMMEWQAKGQDVRLTLSGEDCMVTGNKNLIDELLHNLISNAIRYNYKGGRVDVLVQSRGRRAFLSVKDTGIGIPEKYQKRVFERFFRVDKSRSRQNGGTGLGLNIVKHIVDQHNGELSMISKEGKGTEIKIVL